MDNVKALGEAMLMHQPEDLRGHNSLHCGDDCAGEIVRHLYEAGYLITEVPADERRAVLTISATLDELPEEHRRGVMEAMVASWQDDPVKEEK